MRPALLGDEFTRLQFQHRPRRKHLGTKQLYRDRHMSGWYVCGILVFPECFHVSLGFFFKLEFKFMLPLPSTCKLCKALFFFQSQNKQVYLNLLSS